MGAMWIAIGALFVVVVILWRVVVQVVKRLDRLEARRPASGEGRR